MRTVAIIHLLIIAVTVAAGVFALSYQGKAGFDGIQFYGLFVLLVGVSVCSSIVLAVVVLYKRQ